MSGLRWGDDLDDSDDEPMMSTPSSSNNANVNKTKTGTVIPPTHKSRIDSKGIQVVTSYRPHPANPNQLWKTVTKVRVTKEKRREPPGMGERRKWGRYGAAAKEASDVGNNLEGEQKELPSTIQSKEEIFLEDPNADNDMQDEDATKAIAGNLTAFWAKQQRRQLERKYDVGDSTGAGGPDGAGAAGPGVAGVGAKPGGASGGWTQVGVGGGSASAGAASGKYVPPSQRGGLAGAGGPGASAFKPERRMDDLNTIRVTNISENTTEADLQDLFQRFGRISRVYLAKDKETLISRGFAFVSFVNKEHAANAMEQLQGFGYDHLILKLEWARPNTPKDPASSGTEFRSGYGKALAQDTKEKVSYASNLTTGTR